MDESRSLLRADLRQRRQALDGATRFAAARAVAEHLDAIPGFVAAQRVAGYWAIAGELPLSSVVARLDRDAARAFLLPKLGGKSGKLGFVRWRVGEPVATNRFGIPEPTAAAAVDASSLDVVLLPVVAFDRHGHRLGTGGGYYDRTFAFRQVESPPPLLIGVAYAFQEIESIEVAAWDVNVDWVVTEREAIECGGGELSDPVAPCGAPAGHGCGAIALPTLSLFEKQVDSIACACARASGAIP